MLDQFELKQRYNEYLRELEQEHLYQQVKANESNRYREVLTRLNNFLVSIRLHLKDQIIELFAMALPDH